MNASMVKSPSGSDELFGKHIADRGNGFGQSQRSLGVADLEEAAVTLRLQAGAEIPEIEACVGFALLQLL